MLFSIQRSPECSGWFPNTPRHVISNVDAVYTNTDESKIIEELENYGFSFKYAQDRAGHYYTLIGIKEDVLLK